MYALIDSHCHLALSDFDPDWLAVLTRAQQQGLKALVIPATDRRSWQQISHLCHLAKQQATLPLAAAIGLHPCFAHQPDDIECLADTLKPKHNLNVDWVALGEFGLDAVAGTLTMAKQIELCQQQLRLAREHDLPVILHVRKAHNELLTLLARNPVPGGVVHGFSGSVDLAKQYLRHGLKLGVSGIITYPRANKTRQAIAQLPLCALVLETDAPDLPIIGFQGQRNEPSRLTLILETLAQLIDRPPEQLAPILFANTLALFPKLQNLDLHR